MHSSPQTRTPPNSGLTPIGPLADASARAGVCSRRRRSLAPSSLKCSDGARKSLGGPWLDSPARVHSGAASLTLFPTHASLGVWGQRSPWINQHFQD